MSDNHEARLISVEKDVEFLKGQAVQKEHVRVMMEPFMIEQTVQGKRLDKLTDNLERQTATSEKLSEKIESILEDFHKSLIAQAEARQIGNIIKAWLPLTAAFLLLMGTLCGIVIFVYRIAPPGTLGK